MRAVQLLTALLVSSCASVAHHPPPGIEEAAPIAVARLDNGVGVVALGEVGELELGLFAKASPENEPIGLEGVSGLFVSLSLERAGAISDVSPSARALALGGHLEAVSDGAIVGWALRLGPCDACPADRLDEAWALLLDVALTPDLRASSVTRRAEQYRDALLARVDTLSEAAWRWAAALGAGHGRPLGNRPTEGAASVVNREALVRLQRSLMSPERLVAVGPPMPAEARARLGALGPTPPGATEATRCPAPPQTVFGLAATGIAASVVARSAPGPGMVGRAQLERALDAARAEPTLRERRVELVDLGSVAVLVDEGGAEPLDAWLARALALPPGTSRPGTRVLAREALYGRSPPGPVSLGEPITVWYGDPALFPALPVRLPRDAARCRAP
jgi:hypothetical protein